MESTLQILSTILPVILLLGIGIICRRYSLINRTGIDTLKFVVVNIALPAVLIQAFATMEYGVKNILLTISLYGACILAWGLGGVARILLKADSVFLPFLTTCFEGGMMGYALYSLLYGSETVGLFAGVDLGQSLFIFTMYKILIGLQVEDAAKPSFKELGMDMVKSPIIIAIISGVLMGATGFYEWLSTFGGNTVFDACTSFASAPTSAIILITIGYDLVITQVPWKEVCKVLLSRYSIMIVLRIVLGFLFKLIGFGDMLNHALNIMLILPPPYVLPVFAKDEKEQTYLASSISVTTLVTLLCFMVMAILGI